MTGAVALLLASTALGALVIIDDEDLRDSGRVWDLKNGGSTYTPVEEGSLTGGPRIAADGFDEGLVLSVDGDAFVDPNGTGDLTNGGKTIKTGPRVTSGVRVSRTDSAKGPYLRSLIRLENVGGIPFNGDVVMGSNLGTDGNEVTRGSSNGDLTFSGVDRWVVSGFNGDLDPGDDPVLGFALFGKKADTRTDTIIDGPGEGSVSVDYEIQLAPGATRYLLFYTEMHAFPSGALRSMKKYDKRGLSRPLLRGIGKPIQKKIVNWELRGRG